MHPKKVIRGAMALTAAFLLLSAPAALAQPGNERTIIRISDPIMVPGTTLQPGTYVFELLDSTSSQNIVHIRSEDGSKTLTTALTIPMEREDPKGDLVLKLNPTEGGTPAMKGWFYPGSIYGHQFVYSDEEARRIAQRTKTVVLSHDVKGSDMEQAKIYVYDANAQRGDWQQDTATARKWKEWRKQQRARTDASQAGKPDVSTTRTDRATAKVAAPAAGDRQESTAPMVAAGTQGMSVKLDDIEDNPQKYIGQTVSVDAEVDEVLGPRLFKIDEPNWADVDREILVFMPSHLAALVKEDDRVTVTGTIRKFARAEFERDFDWLDLTPEFEARLSTRPVLVASRIVGGDSNVAMVIETQEASTARTEQTPATGGQQPVGTAGTGAATAAGALTDLQALEDADEEFVGRRVNLQNVSVMGMAQNGGFFVRSGDTQLLVLPANEKTTVAAGQTVRIQGVVLQMPRPMRDRLQKGGNWNEDVYVLATNLGK